MGPVPRAETRDRFAAAAIDFLPPFIVVLACHLAMAPNLGFWLLALSCVWFVTRDWLFDGRSPGKRWFHLQVIDDQTQSLPTTAQLLLRNAIFGVPGLNVLAAIAELIILAMREDGSRLSDDYAGTSVVVRTAELDAHIARTQTRSAIPPSLKLFLKKQAAAKRKSEPTPAPAEPEPSSPPESSEATTPHDSLAETS